MEAEHVVEVLQLLGDAGIEVWLDGGWGVDALLGRQTRAHDDLDLIVSLDDVSKLQEVLAERGYSLAGGGAPVSFELTDKRGRQIVHPVVFTEEGDGRYRMRNGEEWLYPAAGFAGTGFVLGRRVRCLTPEVQVLCHAGYEPEAEDLHDLHARFGVELPPDV